MGTRVSLESVSRDDLHLDVLPLATQKAFLFCTKQPLFARSGLYLAGGTALALQVGHRQSVDLDFFTSHKAFNERELEEELLSFHQWETTLQRKGTLYGKLLKAKMSLIAYPFFVPASPFVTCGTVRILTEVLKDCRTNPVGVDNYGSTALHFAASRGDAAILETLLENAGDNYEFVEFF